MKYKKLDSKTKKRYIKYHRNYSRLAKQFKELSTIYDNALKEDKVIESAIYRMENIGEYLSLVFRMGKITLDVCTEHGIDIRDGQDYIEIEL